MIVAIISTVLGLLRHGPFVDPTPGVVGGTDGDSPVGGREEHGRAEWPDEASPGRGRGARVLVYGVLLVTRKLHRLCPPY